MLAPSLSKSKGILYMLSAMWIFATLNAVSKQIVPSCPIMQVVFFRNFFALLPAAFLVRHTGGISTLKTQDIKYFFLLACIGVMAFFGLFMSLKLLPLADAVTLHFSETLFLTLVAAFILKEPVGWHRYLAVFIGFVGVIIMMRPTSDMINIGALYALLFAVCDTFVMISSRILTQRNPSSSVAFYYAMMASLISFLFLPFYWVQPQGWDWVGLIILGIGGGIGQICVFQAYRYAYASIVAPMIFTALLWSIFYGFILWGEVPDQTTIMGALLIISASLFIIWRENKTQDRSSK